MNYTPQHIANYFLERGRLEGVPISPLKLLKLVYIAYGWFIAITKGKRLFTETIEAWEHGPVVPTLYHEFKHYGRNPITEYSEEYDPEMENFTIPRVTDDDTLVVLSKVWAAYKGFSAWALRQKTHEADGPWDRVHNPLVRNCALNDDDIREHYEQRLSTYFG